MAKSIIGFHYSIGGNKNGIGALIDKLNQAGIPIMLKGTDDAGLCFEGQTKGQQHGVNNHLIYRVSTAGQGNVVQYDVPDYVKHPKDAALEHWNKTVAKWPQELDKSIVWMEPINEPRAKLGEGDVQWGNLHPVDWLGYFMLEYAKLANTAGFKVCGPSFNSGEPEVFGTNDFELPGMLGYMAYCASNPTLAALSMHEYGGGKLSDYPVLWGRAEGMIAAADKNNIPRTFPIFMTEWGTGSYHDAPRWPEVKEHWDIFNVWAAKWPQVKGVAAWTLQDGWGGISDDLQTWFAPLADYTVNTNFPVGKQPAQTHAVFGGTLPPGGDIPTFEERLWTASVQEQKTNGVVFNPALGLWKKIEADNLRVVTHERPFEGVNYQVGEKTDRSERWVYTWDAQQGIKRFDNPSTTPVPVPAVLSVWPVNTFIITQCFGANPHIYIPLGVPGHDGIDIPVPSNTIIKSMGPGIIKVIGTNPNVNYGLNVRVQHADGLEIIYAHMNRIDVQVGQQVAAGQQLGLSGNTGNTTGPHLHLAFKKAGVTYIDKEGHPWPSNLTNPWPYIKHLYKPAGAQQLSGWVYDYATEGSDGQGVMTEAVVTNLRVGPGTNHAIIGKVPVLTMVEITGVKVNGYHPVTVMAEPFGALPIDLTRFTIADPFCWRVVRSANGQEDVQDMDLGNGYWVRRKNQLAEWWRYHQGLFYLVHDTSPSAERVYTLTKDGQPGAPKHPASMHVGQQWIESGTHHVQYRMKNGCVLSTDNSGIAQNTAILVDHRHNYVFNGYGQNMLFQEVIWLKTGVETQIYGRRDDRPCGWIGWAAPWGSSEVVEIHWNRGRLLQEPNRYCNW